MAKLGDTDTLDELSSHLSERWVWKDETNTLELTSFVRSSSLNHNKRTKRVSTPGMLAQERRNETRGPRQLMVARAGQRSGGISIKRVNNYSAKPGPRYNATADQHIITMNDVKNVAKNHPIKKDTRNLPAFQELYNSKQLDDFLWAALNYFGAFFEKKALEEKPKPMAVEPSLAEKKAIALVSSKEEEAKRSLAQCYGVLVLGLGLEDGHHMHCGRKRSSATQKDREQYETLYNFVSNVTWITFRRPHLEVIEKELGRLLRSDTFNPAGRPKIDNEVYAKDRLKRDSVKQTLTPAEYRRLQPKRPAIKSIVNQRSPVITSLLPTSTEAAQQFTNRREAPPFVNVDQQKLTDNKHTYSNRVGIIGESISGFNPENLIPIGDDGGPNELRVPDINNDNLKTASVLYCKEGTESIQEDTSSIKQQLESISTDNH